MNREVERVYVARPFKKWLKQQANQSDKTVLDFTEELANMKDPFKQDKDKKRGFDFV